METLLLIVLTEWVRITKWCTGNSETKSISSVYLRLGLEELILDRCCCFYCLFSLNQGIRCSTLNSGWLRDHPLVVDISQCWEWLRKVQTVEGSRYLNLACLLTPTGLKGSASDGGLLCDLRGAFGVGSVRALWSQRSMLKVCYKAQICAGWQTLRDLSTSPTPGLCDQVPGLLYQSYPWSRNQQAWGEISSRSPFSCVSNLLYCTYKICLYAVTVSTLLQWRNLSRLQILTL